MRDHDHDHHDHHDHSGHHHGAGDHQHAPASFGREFTIGVTLNLAYAFGEGLQLSSLAGRVAQASLAEDTQALCLEHTPSP